MAGGLGAVSAALAGYVSRTFLKSQDAAAGHLRAYFEQPLVFSRYLAAEGLLQDDGMDQAKRSEVLGLLVLVLAMAADPKDPPSEDEPTSSSSRMRPCPSAGLRRLGNRRSGDRWGLVWVGLGRRSFHDRLPIFSQRSGF